MKLRAVIAGVGMTKFGKHLECGLKALGGEAVQAALADAGVDARQLEVAYVGNAAAGLVTGQESIRGQVILRALGIGRIPVINVENACASGSTALQQACGAVSAGQYEVALALGVEKLTHPDKAKTFAAFSGAVDVEVLAGMLAQLRHAAEEGGARAASTGAGEKRSMFMDLYAAVARAHMKQYGTTVEQFAAIAAKNSHHGSLNPRAQLREVMSVADVLSAPMVAEPLTRPMCSPIGDGAAAAVIVSTRRARALGIRRPVRVLSSVLHAGWDHGINDPGTVEICAREAYKEAGVGPRELDVIECHDATAPAELLAYESLGLCGKGEGGKLIDSQMTWLGGAIPVNPSGGLLRKGHPVGATGLAQIVELTEQLQGRAGPRQVDGARLALAQNGGGNIGIDAAAMCVTILAV
jgi:acetyl-CoA acetyltransferase